MIGPILLVAALLGAMLLPHAPGRFDLSAATISLLARLLAWMSLILTPLGVLWWIDRRRDRLWYSLTRAAVGLLALLTAAAAVAANQATLGIGFAVAVLLPLWSSRRRRDPVSPAPRAAARWFPSLLVIAPLLLVAFSGLVVPRTAAWSRDRAIRHSEPLIAEIEAYRARQGHYPVSLQSLHADVPTGVVGIERFLYEPNGEAYNLFFVRPAVELDALEVVMFNPLDEHRFASHELDLLQYHGEELDLRRGDRRRTVLSQPHWVSILFD